MNGRNNFLNERRKSSLRNSGLQLVAILFLTFTFQWVKGQEHSVRLDDCYRWAKENSPVFRQLELNEVIRELRQDNILTANLPQIELKGQATYQSEVTKLNLNLPNVDFPTLSKDQYGLYFDVSQNIYDGGRTKASRELEEKSYEVENQNTIVDLFQVNEKINQAFFDILILEKQKIILSVAIQTLDERIAEVESAVKNQMLTANELDILQVEKEERLRDLNQIASDKKAAVRVLALLTGHQLSLQSNFQAPEVLLFEGEIIRPELDYFHSQNEKLSSSEELIRKERNPRIYGFARTGVGKPGLNMLDDEFKSYYLVGLGVNWKVTDWKKTKRERLLIHQQKELVNSRQEDFLLAVNHQLISLQEGIEYLNRQLRHDDAILKMRMNIARRSASALMNGEITSSDYMEDLNAENSARLVKESHLIQLKYAIIRYNTMKGKLLE